MRKPRTDRNSERTKNEKSGELLAAKKRKRGEEDRNKTRTMPNHEDQQDLDEGSEQETTIENMEKKGEEERRTRMQESTDEIANHTEWIGSNLKYKRPSVGARIGTNNFQRKLYPSNENVIEMIEQCERLKIDLLLGTEPGQGTIENRLRTKNTLREYGYGIITVTRDDTTIGGGLALILGPRWAKLPFSKRTYHGGISGRTFSEAIERMGLTTVL